MPHLDSSQLATRTLAAELARESRRNAARIREQIEDGTAGIGGRRRPKKTISKETTKPKEVA